MERSADAALEASMEDSTEELIRPPQRRFTHVVLDNAMSPLGVAREGLHAVEIIGICYILIVQSSCGRAFAPARVWFLQYWLVSLGTAKTITCTVCLWQEHRYGLACLKFVKGITDCFAYLWGIYLCLAGNRVSCDLLTYGCDSIVCFHLLELSIALLCCERADILGRLGLQRFQTEDPADRVMKSAPMCLRRPPWNLSGQWLLGENKMSLCLRHWGPVGALFSMNEPTGGETFFGRVLPSGPQEHDAWIVVGAFGSRQAVLGRVSPDGCAIKWSSSAQWVRETTESPIPRIESVDASLRRSYMSCFGISGGVSFLAVLLAVLLATIFSSLFRFAVGIIVIMLCIGFMAYFIYNASLKLPMSGQSRQGACQMICLSVIIFIFSGLIAGFCVLIIRAMVPMCSWIYIAMATSAIVSLVVGLGVGLSNKRASNQDPATWQCIKRPATETLDFNGLEEFRLQCEKWKSMYPFTLGLVQLLYIDNPRLEENFQRERAGMVQDGVDYSNVRRLYHGTSAAAAKDIVDQGFKLPSWSGRSGMFGKGIYFADSPLKSWQYSCGHGWDWILVCDVCLGRQKEMAKADSRFTITKLENPLSASKDTPLTHDSLVGLTKEQGGSLRLPEYIVFRPEQILPLFLVQVREEHVEPDQ